MTREMETWLSDSRVGNNSVVDHRSRLKQADNENSGTVTVLVSYWKEART